MLKGDVLKGPGSLGERGEARAAGDELAALREQVASLEQELAATRLAQRQLERFADDFHRIYAEARLRLQQMTTLYQVSAAIGATVDPNEVLDRTAAGLERLVGGQGLAIYLLDDHQSQLDRRLVTHNPDCEATVESLAPGEGPLGRCLAGGEPIVEAHGCRAETRGWVLALPLTAGSQQLGGVLIFRDSTDGFSQDDQHLAEMVASQAAMAVQHARLATTDGLTGLYNRRYFEQALEFECDRAQRANRPLGLLMIDVDHFKRFNDRFGHPAGDAVLRAVAAALVGGLRRTDILARVGGEEFAAILPEEDPGAVGVAAERLRRVVEQSPQLRFEGAALPGIRVSIGGASLAAEQLSPRALMRAADDALRLAKRAGRNRSQVATAPGDGR